MAPPMHPTPPSADRRVPVGPSRRRFLQAGGFATAALALGACASDESVGSGATTVGPAGDSSTTDAQAGSAGPTPVTNALTVADFAGLATCVLLPEQTAGPFPLDEQFVRRDITEGIDGRPMHLGFRVVDNACAAVPGAQVEVWHCDVTGDYSAFEDGGSGKDEGPGTTFLRGTQIADADGIVELFSIVPGWYEGRAVHIHLRVRVDDATVLTSQVYFDPAHLETVYGRAPYAERGLPDTSNEDDGFAGDVATNGTLLATSEATTERGEPSTLALLNLGIDPAATSQ